MEEYKGRINLSKETMLYIVNNIFNQNIRESTTKENILKLVKDMYQNADDEKIIKMLPYDSYRILEKLIEYSKNNSDIKSFVYKYEYANIKFLEDAMIIVCRAKYGKYNYSINLENMEFLKRLFSKENVKLAKKYRKLELLIKGLLYSYGIVEFEFFKDQISKFMGEKITEEELNDIIFTRLNLNRIAKVSNVKINNNKKRTKFITYIDGELWPIDKILKEQIVRNLMYKQFTEIEILKREEYFINSKGEKLYKFLNGDKNLKNDFNFKTILKYNELGFNVLNFFSNSYKFENELELAEFTKLFIDWHNNTPQYVLCGYTPNELSSIYYKR